jgi:hypothetical protein
MPHFIEILSLIVQKETIQVCIDVRLEISCNFHLSSVKFSEMGLNSTFPIKESLVMMGCFDTNTSHLYHSNTFCHCFTPKLFIIFHFIE